MSDVMLFGVLRMPYEMAMESEISRLQFYGRAQEAADRLEAAERATHSAMPSPPSGASAEHKELTFKLMMAKCASCSCQVKTPDSTWHDAHCLYRVLGEAIAAIKSAAPVAPSGAQEVHQWRQRTIGSFVPAWYDAPKSEAYQRVDEHYEARTLYTAPVPAIGGPVQDERAAFEAWCISKKWSIKPAREESLDDYMDSSTEVAWYGWQACAALAAKTAPGQQANVALPANLREFVEAIAHRFDAIDRETDDEFCKGCSGLSVWDEDTRQSYTHHRPDCIVLRAEAILAAAPVAQEGASPTKPAPEAE